MRVGPTLSMLPLLVSRTRLFWCFARLMSLADELDIASQSLLALDRLGEQWLGCWPSPDLSLDLCLVPAGLLVGLVSFACFS